jgi:L-lactate dehydrogenase complex protein LldG
MKGLMNAILESSEVFESFKARAGAVGACVERVANKALALEFVVRQLRQEGVSEKLRSGAVWAGCAMVNPADQKKLEAAVPGLKFAVTRDLAANARVGISQVDWALAATGTLVQCAEEVDKRLVSTLPAVHIALVATSALLPDLGSVVARMDPRKAAYLSFITGPSRTADIERVLTIGVHGPERLIVVFVDDLEVAA